MTGITTVIFDVYETLAHNNAALWLQTFGEICRTQNLAMEPDELWSRWKALDVNFRKERLNLKEPEKSPPFKSYEEAWRDCFQETFREAGLDGDAAAAARMAVEDMGRREWYPDAIEALPQVQARWRTGVLSNADDAYLYPTLQSMRLPFEAVLSSEAARAYKPHSASFRLIMDMLGVKAEECVYVGDNQFDDVMGAREVGMKAVWLNRKETAPDPQLPLPDHQIRSLTELLQVLPR